MKSKKANPFVITTLIFFMTTVMFGLLTTGVIMKYRKATVTTNTDKLSDEEIEKLESFVEWVKRKIEGEDDSDEES